MQKHKIKLRCLDVNPISLQSKKIQKYFYPFRHFGHCSLNYISDLHTFSADAWISYKTDPFHSDPIYLLEHFFWKN